MNKITIVIVLIAYFTFATIVLSFVNQDIEVGLHNNTITKTLVGTANNAQILAGTNINGDTTDLKLFGYTVYQVPGFSFINALVSVAVLPQWAFFVFVTLPLSILIVVALLLIFGIGGS